MQLISPYCTSVYFTKIIEWLILLVREEKIWINNKNWYMWLKGKYILSIIYDHPFCKTIPGPSWTWFGNCSQFVILRESLARNVFLSFFLLNSFFLKQIFKKKQKTSGMWFLTPIPNIAISGKGQQKYIRLNYHRLDGLKKKQLFFKVLEVGSPRLGCQHGWVKKRRELVH